MPLSDHEKRLLDEIEQTLRTDDPSLASSLRVARPLPKHRNLVSLAALGLVVGVVLLITALALRSTVGTILGVVAYVLIVAGVDCGWRIFAQVRGTRGAARSTKGATGS